MDNKNNVIDLGDTLGLPVANSVKPPEFQDAEIVNDDTTANDGPVFNDAHEPEPQPEPAPGDYMPPRAIAETIVNLLDGLQSSVVPFLREKKIFTLKELEILQTIDRTGSTIYSQNSPEHKVFLKWKKHERVVEQIPFNKGEKSRLVDATARYAETTNMKVSPLSGLLMAYSEVILKRSAIFFNE